MGTATKELKSQSLLLTAELRKRLSKIFGEQIRVILYGSQAKGEAMEDSDIDVLVVLPDLEKSTLDMVFDVAWEIGFEAEKVISVVPATDKEMEQLSASPFFQTVKREGIPA